VCSNEDGKPAWDDHIGLTLQGKPLVFRERTMMLTREEKKQ
jgi:hypothetical protein